MQKFLTDIHTHSLFSFDGEEQLKDIIACALDKGVAFYGVSEHFDYDLLVRGNTVNRRMIDENGYFHTARHLQEDYQGAMNMLVGAEFSYIDDKKALGMYQSVVDKYAPDFIVNSVHSVGGQDYYDQTLYFKAGGQVRDKAETYREYLATILQSLHAPYHYDIVGHIGYATRYAPYEDKRLLYKDFAKEIDEILQVIIQKDKILEFNTSGKNAVSITDLDIFRRYYRLGGRNISYGSDTHGRARICDKREQAVGVLKEIGFTHLCVPCRGEYIKVEL